MIPFLLFQAPPPAPQVQSQPMAIEVGGAMPPALPVLAGTPSVAARPETPPFARLQAWAGPGSEALGFTADSLKDFLEARKADLSAARQPKWSDWLKRLAGSGSANLRAWALTRRVEAGSYEDFEAFQAAITEHLFGISKPGSGRDDRTITPPPFTGIRDMPDALHIDHRSAFWRSLRKTILGTPDRKLSPGLYSIWCYGTHPDQKDLILDLAAHVEAQPTVRTPTDDPWNDSRFWIVMDWAVAWGTREDLDAIRGALKPGLPRIVFERMISKLEAIKGYFTTRALPGGFGSPSDLQQAPGNIQEPRGQIPAPPEPFDFSQIKVDKFPAPPRYPEEARNRKVMSVLVVDMVVDPEGKPVSCRPEPGPWLAFFAPTALEYAGRWTFQPARLNGVPQFARFRLTMPFRLRN